MYRFKLPIGDYSKDGHEQCDYYIVEANAPIEDIVTVYKKMNLEYGLDEEFQEYEFDTFSKGFLNSKFAEDIDLNKYLDEEEDYPTISSKDLAQLIIDALILFDSNLELKIVNDDIPDISHYVSLPGYGLFE